MGCLYNLFFRKKKKKCYYYIDEDKPYSQDKYYSKTKITGVDQTDKDDNKNNERNEETLFNKFNTIFNCILFKKENLDVRLLNLTKELPLNFKILDGNINITFAVKIGKKIKKINNHTYIFEKSKLKLDIKLIKDKNDIHNELFNEDKIKE